MKRIVEYISLDPLCADNTEVFIGGSKEELDNIQADYEEFLDTYNTRWVSEVIEES